MWLEELAMRRLRHWISMPLMVDVPDLGIAQKKRMSSLYRPIVMGWSLTSLEFSKNLVSKVSWTWCGKTSLVVFQFRENDSDDPIVLVCLSFSPFSLKRGASKSKIIAKASKMTTLQRFLCVQMMNVSVDVSLDKVFFIIVWAFSLLCQSCRSFWFYILSDRFGWTLTCYRRQK